MSDVTEAPNSPDEAGLSSTLKYEKNQYNNANVFLPNTPVTIRIVHSCESQIKRVVVKKATSSWLSLAHQPELVRAKIETWRIRVECTPQSCRIKIIPYFFHAAESTAVDKKENRTKLCPFPPTFEYANSNNLCDRRAMLERYIQSIIDVREYRETDIVLRLLEVSPLSFVNCTGSLKLKEDCVNKLPSYNYFNKCCCVAGICLQRRWLILKDSYFVYMKQHGDKVKAKDIDKSEKRKLRLAFSIELSGKNRSWRLCNIFLMDQNFAFKTKTVERSGQCQLKLYNTLGELVVVCQSEDRMNDWDTILSSHIYQDGTRDFIQYNRFGSFVPPRSDTQICMFIDGACYMEAVAKAIAQAQHEVFITDWCMHPTVFLRRPVSDNRWRLDMLLHAKAKQGVKIYILLYKESELAVKFRSLKVKRWLRSLHSNIYIYRSPRSTRLWSHHEKMVAVDQSIVFLGGIDLCFGRWDTNDHRLQDVHKIARVQKVNAELRRIRSLRKRSRSNVYSQSKQATDFANLEMHNIESDGDQTSSSGEQTPKPRHRRLTNVIQRAGDAMLSIMYQMALDKKESLRVLDDQMSPAYCESEWGNYDKDINLVYDNPSFEEDTTTNILVRKELASLEELSQAGQRCTWIGQDYVNWSLVEPTAKEHPALDLVDRTCVPRTPWHDVGCVFVGTAACDISRHFIQRWNQIRSRKIRSAPKGSAKRIIQRLVPALLPSHQCSPWTETKLSTVLVDPRQSAVCTVQALRSIANWSLGVQLGDKKGFRKSFRKLFHQNLPSRYKSSNDLDETKEQIGLEKSVLNAYIDMINEAENFIYIENQYFISYILKPQEDQPGDEDIENDGNSTNERSPHKPASDQLQPSNSNGLVKNRICEAIYLRILRAYNEGKIFRVFIMLPSLTAFKGEVGTSSGNYIHAILHYTRQSLFTGEYALIPRLKNVLPNPEDYVSICSLRTYDEWPDGSIRTELVYIHSKVMIVDDKKMILGSANINDRSMLGFRDSELAITIESNSENDLIDGKFANSSVKVHPFIQRFRRSLMAEFLGMLPKISKYSRMYMHLDVLNDPVSDEFFHDVWNATAVKNGEIFEKVFNCIPGSGLLTFQDCAQRRRQVPLIISDREKAVELLKDVRGFLVPFYSDFLANESLLFPVGSIERMIPEVIWT
ncbi:unnamed protein product [Schistosoma turkestanicum]|nr:unnamed protein product [Schistosoma turkestanicum]